MIIRTQFFAFRAQLIGVVGTLLTAIASHSPALTFNVTYDASTVGAPTGFFTAFQAAIDFYQASYTDPITINLHVGWGEINGQSLKPGNLGQSSTPHQVSVQYSQLKSVLTKDAKSADDATAVASLPAVDPTHGSTFVMASAEAKALGLLAGNATGVDGYIGFRSTAAYTFDPTNRQVSGKYDFFGLAGHEISEIMGRYGLGQNGATSGRYSPIDLFRYSSAGILDLVPTNGAYFSIDGGSAAINTFNGTGGGDLSDWLGLTLDSFNESLTLGRKLEISSGDLTEMDVIGYDRTVGPPPLTIKSVGPNGIHFSWSSPSTGFTLETNSDLTGTNWLPAGYTLSTTNGTNYSITIASPPAQNVFFRLKQ